MSKQVWKYNVRIDSSADTFQIPMLAKILHVESQSPSSSNYFQFWAEVDTDAPLEERTFIVVGTGHEIGPGYEYRGTALVDIEVWHLYERV